MNKIFVGPLVHTFSPTQIEYSPSTVLGVDASGKISFIEYHKPLEQVLSSLQWSQDQTQIIHLNHGEFLLPGFIDTHTHAPQFPNIGRGQQYELLDWLANITFPAEEKLADPKYATLLYNQVVKRVLSFGTTTCCYYGSLHLEATKILADEVHIAGQRAFVGKCNMDRNSSPSYVEPSPELSIEDTKSLIEYIHTLSALPTGSALVHPIITPRFAIACSSELLQGLGELAATDQSVAIQTHISENASEIQFTKELFPDAPHYAGVYDMYGLLRHNTVLGHACHFSEEEIALVKERNAGIAHCPTSNFNIRSGMAKVGMYLDRGIKVGLGTDCSGGYSPSILTTIQHASITSKILSLSPPPSTALEGGLESKQFPLSTLLYLATLGGAAVCCLQDKVGNFVVGKEFDALVVSVFGKKEPGEEVQSGVGGCGNPAVWYGEEDDLETLFERFLFGGDDRNIKEVYVCGRLVSGWGKK